MLQLVLAQSTTVAPHKAIQLGRGIEAQWKPRLRDDVENRTMAPYPEPLGRYSWKCPTQMGLSHRERFSPRMFSLQKLQRETFPITIVCYANKELILGLTYLLWVLVLFHLFLFLIF